MYDIPWIKSLDYTDLCYVHLLSLCRLYRYNPRYDPEQSIKLIPAEARHITRVTVLLRTKNDERFKCSFYLPHEQAETFRERFIADFTINPKEGDSS